MINLNYRLLWISCRSARNFLQAPAYVVPMRTPRHDSNCQRTPDIAGAGVRARRLVGSQELRYLALILLAGAPLLQESVLPRSVVSGSVPFLSRFFPGSFPVLSRFFPVHQLLAASTVTRSSHTCVPVRWIAHCLLIHPPKYNQVI